MRRRYMIQTKKYSNTTIPIIKWNRTDEGPVIFLLLKDESTGLNASGYASDYIKSENLKLVDVLTNDTIDVSNYEVTVDPQDTPYLYLKISKYTYFQGVALYELTLQGNTYLIGFSIVSSYYYCNLLYNYGIKSFVEMESNKCPCYTIKLGL